MEYTEDEQYRRASIIVDAACKVGKVSYPDFLFQKRSLHMNTLRGVAFYLSWEYGVHARYMAVIAHRTRGNVINQSKRYRNYLRSNDFVSVTLYNNVKAEVEKTIYL